MELTTIFGIERTVKIGSEEVVIKTVELGNLDVVLGIIDVIFDAKGKKQPSARHILNAVTAHYDKVLQLFAVTTNLSEDQIKRLNVAAATKILSEVVKENADFFTASVLPLLQGLAEVVNPEQIQAGKSKSRG